MNDMALQEDRGWSSQWMQQLKRASRSTLFRGSESQVRKRKREETKAGEVKRVSGQMFIIEEQKATV